MWGNWAKDGGTCQSQYVLEYSRWPRPLDMLWRGHKTSTCPTAVSDEQRDSFTIHHSSAQARWQHQTPSSQKWPMIFFEVSMPEPAHSAKLDISNEALRHSTMSCHAPPGSLIQKIHIHILDHSFFSYRWVLQVPSKQGNVCCVCSYSLDWSDASSSKKSITWIFFL
jgi:hypothetical protein